MATTGPVLSWPKSNVIQIMRNVTGRVDRNDPSFTDEIMYDYLNAFLQQEHPQEVQIFQNRTWWDFTIDEDTDDPLPVDLDALGFSSIGGTAYVGYTTEPFTSFKLWWYQDPNQFYARWPWEQVFTPQMPTAVLYYDNQLTFRGPPDQEYNIRISAYQIDYSFAGGSITTPENSVLSGMGSGDTQLRAYLMRYLAYGASLNIFSDYGEMDRYNEIFQVYRRHRAQVLARTWNQLSNQRTAPDF